MEYLFTEELLNKLPTLEHYKQLCYSLSVRGPPYNSLNIDLINAITTIEDIQIYMYNILSRKSAFFNNAILNLINYAKDWPFYIAPNTYTNKLTLEQFFRCINDDFSEYKIHTKKLTYKYNLFYTGKKYKEDVLDHLGEFIDGISPHRPPIDIGYLKCYRKDLIRGTTPDMDFRELPMKDFHTWLKILELPFSVKSKAFNVYKINFTKEWCDYQGKNKKIVRFSDNNIIESKPPQLNKLAPPQLNKLAPPQTKKECDVTKKEYDAPSNILFQENINKLSEYKNIIENLQEENKIYQESSELYFTKCEKLKLENAELQQIRDSYAMANIELQKICDKLKKENTILQERTKILDESNF
jgi:hypothetical protein